MAKLVSNIITATNFPYIQTFVFSKNKMLIKIFHNPRCSKSRQTLALLQERGIEPVIIDYLNSPPTKNELFELLEKLNITAQELIRTGESIIKETNLNLSEMSDDQIIDSMIANPILIQRPIVINGDKAAIGRPPENILQIF